MSAGAHEQLRLLACRYARGCDRRDAAMLDGCMAKAVEIVVPGLPVLSGPDLATNNVAHLAAMFDSTQHRIFNVLYNIDGDTAEGEVYCTASHLLKERRDGMGVIDEWAIRYQDKAVRENGQWKYLRRELVIDWTEEKQVKVD